MSIRGAVSELSKEIERLTAIRDSLLQAESKSIARDAGTAALRPPTKRVTAKKSSGKKAASTKKATRGNRSALQNATAAATKRVVSEATRKKMSDAARARSQAKKASANR